VKETGDHQGSAKLTGEYAESGPAHHFNYIPMKNRNFYRFEKVE
jgi:hypothetical protein